MKRFGQRIFCIAISTLYFACSAGTAFAQPGDPGTDPDIPIDGGVGILLAAGIGYGLKKYRDERKKKRQQL